MTDSQAEAPRPPQITAALVAAMKAVRTVGKNGRNADQNFRYRKYDDIITAANEALVEAGVAITPTVVSMERDQRQVTTKNQARRTVTTTVVKVQYELACAADGSTKVIDWYGEASDYGDKSLGKALSYSEKMMLIEVLKIPVDDPDADPDQHSHAEDTVDAPQQSQTRRRSTARPRTRAERNAPARASQAPAPPPPPAESDDALHADIIERLGVLSDDPETEGGQAALERIWGDVERARIERNAWSVDDYNALKAHVREIAARIKAAADARAKAAAAQMTERRPKASDPDPWADSPATEWNAETLRNEPAPDRKEDADAAPTDTAAAAGAAAPADAPA